MRKIKIFLVDDHKLLLGSMKIMLSKEERFSVVGEAYNGLDFIELLPDLDVDLVLMDIDMPGLNGIDAAKEAFKIRPSLKIITVSMFDDFDNYNKVIEAGVHGFVVKSAHKEELLDAIDVVMANDKYFSSQLLENAIEYMASRKDKSIVKFLLSQREHEVLDLICVGMSSNEIGEELGISPRTVEKHRDSLLRKTKSKNSVTLAVFAVQYGLVKR
ncbi:MAG: response regulator transcription factor [Salinivirgaceae bacterium]|nr:response regulator transcription factor [Salinivirgaceae bacterium]